MKFPHKPFVIFHCMTVVYMGTRARFVPCAVWNHLVRLAIRAMKRNRDLLLFTSIDRLFGAAPYRYIRICIAKLAKARQSGQTALYPYCHIIFCFFFFICFRSTYMRWTSTCERNGWEGKFFNLIEDTIFCDIFSEFGYRKLWNKLDKLILQAIGFLCVRGRACACVCATAAAG